MHASRVRIHRGPLPEHDAVPAAVQFFWTAVGLVLRFRAQSDHTVVLFRFVVLDLQQERYAFPHPNLLPIGDRQVRRAFF